MINLHMSQVPDETYNLLGGAAWPSWSCRDDLYNLKVVDYVDDMHHEFYYEDVTRWSTGSFLWLHQTSWTG
eukprot:1934111-Prorocentrum_lima.AAC.1